MTESNAQLEDPDTIRNLPEGAAKELAIREYWLGNAKMYRDADQIEKLTAEIAALRREHPELAR